MSSSRAPLSSREFVGLMASCMGLVALSIGIMLPAFPDMREEFGLAPDSTSTSWIVTAFFVGLAIGQLFYGPVSDRYGRKPLLYTGLGIMAVGTAASALAPTLGTVVACRVLWGMGAAAPRSLALAMVRDRFSGALMARTMSHIMATFVLVPAIAPSIGGTILTFAPWRSVFWVPFAAAIAVMLWARRLPETLAVDQRRSTSPAALLQAAREVVRTPQTVGFAIGVTFTFGIMTAYVGSSQLIIDEVFGRKEQFPIIFGLLALFLVAGSFLNARFVTRIGLYRVLRGTATYLIGAVTVMAVMAAVTHGTPSLPVFGIAMALLLPAVSVMMPNANTAAMMPLPHVAGMAAALLGSVSTGGGALLGSVLDGRFDGTIGPFAQGVLVFGLIAAAGVLLIGLRGAPARRLTGPIVGAPVAAKE